MAVRTRQKRAIPRASLSNPTYRAGLRYLAFGRALPAVLFGFMGWLQVRRVISMAGSASGAGDLVLHVAPYGMYALFCAIPAGIYLTRPAPRARDGSAAARVAAFGGTCMQLIIGAFVPTGPLLVRLPGVAEYVGLVLSAAGWAFSLWGLLALRRCLSIIPEARRVVTAGPYALVRHPLYLGEITVGVALTLTSPHLVPVAALGVFLTLQFARMGYEERLLTAALPGYAEYASRTPRLVPSLRRRSTPATP